MKFLLDENADHRLLPFLKEQGHDVKVIALDYPHGLSDKEVLEIAVQEKRILITQDISDFGELIFRSQLPHCGILLFRFKSQETNIALKKNRLAYVLSHSPNQLSDFVVITPTKVRIHRNLKNIAA
jgi:predicted nuclease of predicted toxin-antitoxin system